MSASDPPARLVVRLPNWLGDVVMALPALGLVRQMFLDTALTLAGQPSVLPIFEEATDAAPHALMTVNVETETSALRSGGFDAVLLLTNSFRTAWVARRSGIPQRWGYAAGARGPLLTRAVPRPRDDVHQSEYYRRLVLALAAGAPGGTARTDDLASTPLLRPTESTAARAQRFLAQFELAPDATLVGFAPGAAYGHAKRWPPERVAQVITRLSRERGIRCVLVGAGGDREAGRAIESTLPPDVSVINVIGRTDLRLLIGVLRACHAFVSNDSGAMHLAAALGVPVTAIFGPTNEKATAPLGDHDLILRQVFCRPCMLRECPIDHRCMKRIGAEDVYAAVTQRMDRLE